MSDEFDEDEIEDEDVEVPAAASLEWEGTVLALLKKMQQQLNFLEKKIDSLLSQGPSSERSFSGGGGPRFQRSDRPDRRPDRPGFGGHRKGGFGQSSSRPWQGGGGGGGRDRGFRGGERSFGGGGGGDRRPSYGKPRRDDSRGGGHSGGGYEPQKKVFPPRDNRDRG